MFDLDFALQALEGEDFKDTYGTPFRCKIAIRLNIVW